MFKRPVRRPSSEQIRAFYCRRVLRHSVSRTGIIITVPYSRKRIKTGVCLGAIDQRLTVWIQIENDVTVFENVADVFTERNARKKYL